jgi:hypothetical protein
MKFQLLASLAASQLVAAHFGLLYPEWRGDTLAEDTEFDQWVYPCGDVPFEDSPVTDWPLEGGLIAIDLHHDWTYIFINVGLGNDTTDFNITLTPQFLNSTGEGTLALTDLKLPEDSGVTEGAIGSIQVVTVGSSGSGLYNCANVRFTADAETPTNYTTAEGIEFFAVQDQATMDHDHEGGESEGQSEEGADDAAGILSVNMMAVTSVAALSAMFMLEIGF